MNPIDVFLLNRDSEKVFRKKKSFKFFDIKKFILFKNEKGLNQKEDLVLLSPEPSSKDYLFTMDKQEGLADMFDINLE